MYLDKYTNLNRSEVLKLLQSSKPYKRTIAINLLYTKYKLDDNLILIFCEMLSKEKNLYIKLELCNALLLGDIFSVWITVKYLGKIGNNQYKELPIKKFNKHSYPLPRDIIARTLAHMNIEILPEVLNSVKAPLQSSSLYVILFISILAH